MGIFPNFRVENTKYLSCQHLGNYSGSKGDNDVCCRWFFQAKAKNLSICIPILVFKRVVDLAQLAQLYEGVLKWWFPTTMGFPKNDNFGVFLGTSILGNTHIYCRFSGLYQMMETAFTNI